MNAQNNIQVAEDCAKIIEQLIYYAEEKYLKAIKLQNWSFRGEVAQPILHFVGQMKNIICQMENQSLSMDRLSEGSEASSEKGRIDNLWQTERVKMQEQLEKANSQLQQYKYKSQIYHQHWIAQMVQITDKNLQIATLKSQKEKLIKQITANLQLYKKQGDLNSQLSKQCSINYAAYLKQSEALKVEMQNSQFKQSELQEIEQLKAEISALNKTVSQFAQQSSIIQQAYKEMEQENKALQEEIVRLKKEINDLAQSKQWHAQIHLKNKQLQYSSSQDKSLINETPTNRHKAELFECTNGSIRTRKKKKTEETNISKSASNHNREQIYFFNQEDQAGSVEQITWKFHTGQDWQYIFSKATELLSHKLSNHTILQISTLFSHTDRTVDIKIYYITQLVDCIPKIQINYSMIRSKIHPQSTSQKSDHQRQVCEQLVWLGKQKARIVSINDLTISFKEEQILTVIWYEIEAQ